MEASPRQITVPQFTAMKTAARKITVLTAYDFPTARLVDSTGVEAILVGDSLGMVVQGRATTVPVTLDQMIYHGEMVCRAVRHALVVVDMPFASFHLGPHRAIENAARLVQQTGCQAVKLEGGVEQAEIIRALVGAGIPVMAHCGLCPQHIHRLGRFSIQRQREQLLADARAAEDAGAFAMVLECVSSRIAAEITAAASIPTIGIGSGPHCDGQVLVLHDLLNLTAGGRTPKHVKLYADLRAQITEAASRFRDDVRSGAFPGSEQTSDE